jgi:hypothetical protein
MEFKQEAVLACGDRFTAVVNRGGKVVVWGHAIHDLAAPPYLENVIAISAGGGSTALSSFPLWYPHYDNNPSYSDWSPFGGWTKPNIKQYMGTTSVCSASVDLNYY